MQGNTVLGEGASENLVGFSIYDGPVETTEYMWVNIWCMLGWTVGFCHKTAEMYLLTVDKPVRSAQNEMQLWLVGINRVKI